MTDEFIFCPHNTTRLEAYQAAAVHEVGEETGLLVSVSGRLGVWRDDIAVIVIGFWHE